MKLGYSWFVSFFCEMICDCLRNQCQVRQGGEKHVGESDLEQGGKAFTGGAGGALREGLGTALAFPVPRRSSFQSQHVGIIASFLLLMKIISFLLFTSQYLTIWWACELGNINGIQQMLVFLEHFLALVGHCWVSQHLDAIHTWNEMLSFCKTSLSRRTCFFLWNFAFLKILCKALSECIVPRIGLFHNLYF